MLATEKSPVLGIIQRSGEVVIRLLDKVRQATIKPLILQTVAPWTLIHTEEYSIYDRLEAWGYSHKTVNPSVREYVRDEACPELVEGMATAFARCIRTPSKAFGRCCALGCVRTAAFPKPNCRYT